MSRESVYLDVHTIRGHHMINLFMAYVGHKRFPRIERIAQDGKDIELFYRSPLTVVEIPDDFCHECRSWPALNFCRGEDTRIMDREAAEALDVIIGESYRHIELKERFEHLRQELHLPLGIHPSMYEVYDKVYTTTEW